MKRKYLAIMLGMTLAVTPAAVYGEEAADTGMETLVENGTEEKAEPAQVTGEVTEAGESSLTIVKDGDGESETYKVTEETRIEASGGMGPGGAENEPPEKPEGEKPEGQPAGDTQQEARKPEGQPSDDMEEQEPEKPEGQPSDDMKQPSGQMEGMPGMQAKEIALSDIQAGDRVTLSLNEDGSLASVLVQSDQMEGEMPGGPGGMGQQGVDSYEAVITIEEDTDISGESMESTGTDENAVHVTNGADAVLEDVTVSRNSSDSTGGDNASFYGVGAAVLATDGTAAVKNSEITTDASGGAGVFAYGDGVAFVEDCVIETQQDTSGGIHAAGGGTLYAWDTTVVTNGNSAAAVRSDRGGGTMVIDGGSYTSNGSGSPAVYCTADISVNNAELTATGSEAVCIEGLNTLRLYDCNLSGNMSDDEQNDNTWSVIVYQSMSGDSEVGNGTFQMSGGRLTSGNGGIFYTTNTESTLILDGVEIEYPQDSEFFLQCTGNSNARGWGETGDNGADCLFTGIGQQMQGDVIWDSISRLDFYMTEGSILTGAIRQDETWAGEGGEGYCSVVISEDSEWIVTGDSRVSTLSAGGMIVDDTGAFVTVQGSDGTIYVEGDSSYTITVDNYSETVDLSSAGTADTWEEHAADPV